MHARTQDVTCALSPLTSLRVLLDASLPTAAFPAVPSLLPQMPGLMLPQMPGSLPQPIMFPQSTGMEVAQPTGLPQLARMPAAPPASDAHTAPGGGGHVPKAAPAGHSGGTGEVRQVDEARKAKRQQCNRESARRSLQMKNLRLKEMNVEVDTLQQRNARLQVQVDRLHRSREGLERHNQLLFEGIEHMQLQRSLPPERLRQLEQAIAVELSASAAHLEEALHADLDVVIVARHDAAHDSRMHGGDSDGSEDEGYSSEPETAGGDTGSKAGSGTSPRGGSQPPCKMAAVTPAMEPGQAVSSGPVAVPVMTGSAGAADSCAATSGSKAQHPLLAAAAAAATSKPVNPKLLGVDAACWQKAASAFASHLALVAQAAQLQKTKAAHDAAGAVAAAGDSAGITYAGSGALATVAAAHRNLGSDFKLDTGLVDCLQVAGAGAMQAAQHLTQEQQYALANSLSTGSSDGAATTLLTDPVSTARLALAPSMTATAALGPGQAMSAAAADPMLQAGPLQAIPSFAIVQRAGAAGGTVFVVSQVGGEAGGAVTPGADTPASPQQQRGALGSPMTAHLLHVEAASAGSAGSSGLLNAGHCQLHGTTEPMQNGEATVVVAFKGAAAHGRQAGSESPPSKDKGQSEFGSCGAEGEQQGGEHLVAAQRARA